MADTVIPAPRGLLLDGVPNAAASGRTGGPPALTGCCGGGGSRGSFEMVRSIPYGLVMSGGGHDGAGDDGAGGERQGPDDAPDSAPDEVEHWPGLESLPPVPPIEYPPSRPFRRRVKPTPTIRPAALPTSPSYSTAPSGTGPRWPWIAGILLAVLLLVLVPAVFLLGQERETQARAASSTTTTTTTSRPRPSSSTSSSTVPSSTPPSTTSTTTSTLPPVTVPPDPPLTEAIAETSGFVATHRGLSFGEPIVGVRLPDEEFEQRLRELYLSDPKAIEAEADMLKLQGIIAPDADYVKQFLETTPKQTLAYYRFETKQMLLRGTPGSPIGAATKTILVHELTHAVDDHAFDFAARDYGDPTKELLFGFEALVEGDAERIEHQWSQAQGLTPSAIASEGYSDVVSSRMAVKYELGEKLVDDIMARGGQAELDRDFNDPPSTSEQVMHPDKYAAREPAASVPAPTAEGAIAWTGGIGEYTTGQMLGTAVTTSEANRAAAGWGGDQAVVWVQRQRDGGLTCLRISYVMDSPRELDELESAFATWAKQQPNRTARRRDDAVVVTMCAKVPPPPASYGGRPRKE